MIVTIIPPRSHPPPRARPCPCPRLLDIVGFNLGMKKNKLSETHDLSLIAHCFVQSQEGLKLVQSILENLFLYTAVLGARLRQENTERFSSIFISNIFSTKFN